MVSGRRPRILLICTFYPWPIANGGASQRLALLRSALAELGDVELALVSSPEVLREMKENPERQGQGIAIEVESLSFEPSGPWKPFSKLPLGWISRFFGRLALVHGQYKSVPEMASWLRKAAEESRYDLIVAWNLRCAAMAGLTGLKTAIPRVLDVDDVDWHTSLSRTVAHDSASPRRLWMGRLVAWETRRISLPLIKEFDRTWVCSEEDREEIDVPGMQTLANIPFRLPEHPPLIPCEPPGAENHGILLVGSLSWIRNIDGVDHFLDHCWNSIRDRVPDATLRLVGKVDPAHRSRWETFEGVTVEGFVDDLRPVYEACAFTLGLVRWGAGTKIKVVESLAYRRTCVVTPHTLRGYHHDLVHGESLLCGDTDEAMVECCVQLLQDPGLRDELAESGFRVVSERYTAEHFHDVVRKTCEPLLGPG